MNLVRGVCLTIVVLLLCVATAAAAALEDMSQARVSVSSQSDGARARALPGALATVMQRLTGDPDVASRSAVSPLMNSPKRFVQQFRYESAPRGLDLVLRFDLNALRDELVRSGVPIWQTNRPPVLVWLAYDSAAQRALVGDETGGDLRAELRGATHAYGIPIEFPLLDLADQQQVRFSDVAGGFSDAVLEASRRYGTPVVLMGALREGGGQVRGRWSLFLDDRGDQWSGVHAGRRAAVDDMAAELARRLRREYAVLPDLDSTRGLSIRIEGIDGLRGYAHADDLLGALPGVTAVAVERVVADSVTFRLSINVAMDRVIRALDRSPALEMMPSGQSVARDLPSASDPVVAPNLPRYRLLR